IIYLVFASFKTNTEILTHPDRFFPQKFSLENYKIALESSDFYIPLLLKNSLVFTLSRVVIVGAISAMAGFSFAKGNFPLKNVIFVCFSALLFIKLGSVSVYASFEILDFLHIKRSLYALIFLEIFSIPVIDIYLVRSYVKTLPDGILEAAKIDGCSFFGMFVKIALPIIKPILATIFILAFQGSWNAYIGPTIYTATKPEQRTLMVGLMALKSNSGAASNWNLMLAGSTVALLPVLIAYLAANKHFVKGLAAGAVKG
ncbi:MAG: carbohydrate ABC transporter permease, partial [Clostridia bacterium]|nr:carbohydrate ABC transporter permease [Clostridia bacterium]